MKIAGFIEQVETVCIRMLLSAAGLWKAPVPGAPPSAPLAVHLFAEPVLDYEFTSTGISTGFDKTCI